MGRQRVPPDWSALPERELEIHYVGDDETAAGAAVAELLRRHDPSLWQQARRQSFGDEELAQEALADTRLKLWQHRRRFEPGRQTGSAPRSLWRSWAGTVLHRTILDRLRRAGAEWGTEPARTQRHRPRRVAALNDELSSHIDPKGMSPEQESGFAELRAAVLDCLRRLKGTQKPLFDVLVIYYWGGRTQQEIAGLLNVVVSTVCKRLEAARAAMRDCLTRNHPEVSDDR